MPAVAESDNVLIVSHFHDGEPSRAPRQAKRRPNTRHEAENPPCFAAQASVSARSSHHESPGTMIDVD